MTAFNIDLNNVKSSLIEAYHTAAAKSSEWTGRSIVIVKSGTEKALPYLQDQRIAAVSLIAVNILCLYIGDLFSRLVTRILPNDTNAKEAFAQAVGVVVGVGTWGAGVAAFSKYTKLPFTPLAVAGISIATLFTHVILFSPSK